MTTTRTPRTLRGPRAVGAAAAALSIAVGAALGAAAPASAAPPPAATTQAATTQAASPVHHAVQVESWYRTFLGRDSTSDPGSRYWVGRLDRGEAPDAVLADLLRSREHASAAVATITRAYLGSGSVAGQDAWVDAVVSGRRSLEGVEQEVAGSDALLLATSGEGCVADCTPGPGPVPTWYRVVLHRAPSPGELAYWDARVAGRGAPDAARELWYTPEAVTDRVQTHYTGLLQRRASTGEVAYWYRQEVTDDAAVVAQIATSDEFRTRPV